MAWKKLSAWAAVVPKARTRPSTKSWRSSSVKPPKAEDRGDEWVEDEEEDLELELELEPELVDEDEDERCVPGPVLPRSKPSWAPRRSARTRPRWCTATSMLANRAVRRERRSVSAKGEHSS
mmetsp:Transcript_78869/g.168987  ORF Transcript_78869/g.168987 Transcript_78869/m.168987 type:complete len:122 (-) Transcript_78869:526-891(-)